jgi:Asp-tRNA(Asn)/Glu-tRNA(Gln) amidotransferase A subunit family amidase
MDHVGSLARHVDDANLLYRLMRSDYPDRFASMPAATSVPEKGAHSIAPRLGYIGASFEREPSPEVVAHLASVRERFVREGAIVVDLALPEKMPESILSAHRTILKTEASLYHRTLFESHREQYPPHLKAHIESGREILGYRYVEALHQRIAFQKKMYEILSTVDAALMPTAHSTAPKGLTSTGSPSLCAPWSFSGFPSISIPSGLDDQGLPFAVQLVALPMAEEKLIAVASWCERVLAFKESPPA